MRDNDVEQFNREEIDWEGDALRRERDYWRGVAQDAATWAGEVSGMLQDIQPLHDDEAVANEANLNRAVELLEKIVTAWEGEE